MALSTTLFGVSVATVCRCVQDFTTATETLLVPQLICVPSLKGFKNIAAYNEKNWGLLQFVGVSEKHSDNFNWKGWYSSFKELWMERDFFGMYLQKWVGASMTLEFKTFF